jgi:hypothetical protein
MDNGHEIPEMNTKTRLFGPRITEPPYSNPYVFYTFKHFISGFVSVCFTLQ